MVASDMRIFLKKKEKKTRQYEHGRYKTFCEDQKQRIVKYIKKIHYLIPKNDH